MGRSTAHAEAQQAGDWSPLPFAFGDTLWTIDVATPAVTPCVYAGQSGRQAAVLFEGDACVRYVSGDVLFGTSRDAWMAIVRIEERAYLRSPDRLQMAREKAGLP